MKKYLKFAVMAAFTFIAGLTVYHAQARVQLSDAQLENVEALANNEYDEPKHCDVRHYFRLLGFQYIIACQYHKEGNGQYIQYFFHIVAFLLFN